jgi:hypothetical protein
MIQGYLVHRPEPLPSLLSRALALQEAVLS